MHQKCDLETMKMSELKEIAKGLNVIGRHEMKKATLVDAIIAKQPAPVEDNRGNRTEYVDNIRIGVLVAFRIGDKKALSGKVEEIHGFGFVVKTKNGIRFNVRKNNIMWVKTGDRWPRGVYLALKGEQSLDEHKAVN